MFVSKTRMTKLENKVRELEWKLYLLEQTVDEPASHFRPGLREQVDLLADHLGVGFVYGHPKYNVVKIR